MATVVLQGFITAGVAAWENALVAAGHTVDVVATTTAVPASYAADVYCVSRNVTARLANVIDWLTSGKPVIVFDDCNGTDRGCNLSTTHLLISLGLATTRSRERFFNNIMAVDNVHEITAGYNPTLAAGGTSVVVTSVTVTQSVIDLPLPGDGVSLAFGTSSNACLNAGSAIAVFEVGSEISVSGTPTPTTARLAWMGGSARTDSANFSADGNELIERAVIWVLSSAVAPPTADTIVGNLLAPLIAEIQITAFGEGATYRRLVRRAFGSSDPWVQIGVTVTDLEQLLFYDDTLSPNTHYEWAIVAGNDDGETSSNVVDLETPNTGRPDKPTGTVVTPTGEDFAQINLSLYSHPDSSSSDPQEQEDAEHAFVEVVAYTSADVVQAEVIYVPDISDWYLPVIDGLTADGYFIVRYIDRAARPSLPSDPIVFALTILEDEDPPPPAEIGGTVGTPILKQAEFPWPHYRVPITFPTEDFGGGNPIRFYSTITGPGITTSVRGDAYPAPALPYERNYDFLTPGTQVPLPPGEYTVLSHILYTLGSYRRTPVRTTLVTITKVICPARFLTRPYSLLAGAVNEIEVYAPMDYLAAGTITVEYTRNGTSWTPLISGVALVDDAERNGLHREAGIAVAAFNFDADSNVHADRWIWFRNRLVPTEGEPSDWRMSPPMFIDNAAVGIVRVGGTFVLTDFNIHGPVGVEGRLTQETIDDVSLIKYVAVPGDKIYLELKESVLGTAPRIMDVLMEAKFASSNGFGNYFQYVPDMRSVFGAGAFMDGTFKALVARFSGRYGATGTALGQHIGVSTFSHWATGNRLGLGTGVLSIVADAGAGESSQLVDFSRTQWVNNWRYGDPRYYMGGRFALEETYPDETHRYRGRLVQHGPGSEDVAGFEGERVLDNVVLPFGKPGIYLKSDSYSTTYLYGFIAFGEGSEEDPELAVPYEKAWAFELDGHVFYVLNRIEGKSLIFDTITRQWSRWYTGDRLYWNMFRGIVWRGRVVAADNAEPVVWELDPYSELDEGETLIARAVTGFLSLRDKFAFRQGSARLTASMGAPTENPATVELRFSDDGGNTWVGPFVETIEPGNFTQRLKFRSLGRMRAPGRIWEIRDTGGLVRIDDLDSTHEGG